MARIRPFRALRYHPAQVPDLAAATLPLVDGLLEREGARLRRHPYHSLHLVAPATPTDGAAALAQWRNRGVLQPDPLPAIYPYYQRYSLFGESTLYTRKGFVALVHLENPDGSPSIRTHEGYLPHAVAQRLPILEATALSGAPLHAFYQAPLGAVEDVLDDVMRLPHLRVPDSQGVQHVLGILQHGRQLETLRTALQGVQLYIADGHHRLELATRYYAQQKALYPHAPDLPAAYVPVYLTNTETDRQRILPTHRLVTLPPGFDVPGFLAALAPHFVLKPADNRRPLYQDLVGGLATFGLIVGGQEYLLDLQPGLRPEDLVPDTFAPAVRRLDYTLIHYALMDRLLGIPYAEQAQSPRIEYTKDVARVINRACTEAHTLGLLMPEVALADLLAVADAGAQMPPKSTYFYPKVLGGLLFASLHPADYQTGLDARYARV